MGFVASTKRKRLYGTGKDHPRFRHGHSLQGKKTVEYYTWHRMIQRCTNPRHPKFKNYGGRGIRVCQRWTVFENFLADMGPKPSAEFSIDRVNNDGHYEPGNCRWATNREQSRNRRQRPAQVRDSNTGRFLKSNVEPK